MRTHKSYFPHLAVLLLGCLTAGNSLQAAPNPQIAELDKQIAAAHAEQAELARKRTALQGNLAPVRQQIAGMEAVVAGFEAIERDGHRQVGAIQKQINALDAEIAKLTAPYDLSVAWKAYSSASDAGKPIAFRVLFRLARGRDPNNEEMAQYRLEAKILEIEIRKKAIVPMGLALARLGNTLVEFPKFVAGLTATVQNKTLEIVNNVNSAVQAVKGFIDNVAADPELTGAMKPAMQVASDALNQYHGATDPINKVLGLADEVKAKAQAMADDSYRQYKESVYGTVDPKSAREKAQGKRAELVQAIDKLRAGLRDVAERKVPATSALAAFRQAESTLLGQIARLQDPLATLQEKISLAEDRKADLAFQDKMAGVTLTPHVSGLGYFHVSGLGRYRRQVDLALDEVTAHNLNFPRSAAYTLPIQLSQAGAVPCLYNCRSSKDGKSSTCSRSTMNVVRGGPSLPHYGDIAPVVEGGGLRVEQKQGLLVAVAAGEGKVSAPEVSGMVGTKWARHALYDQRPTHGSQMRGQSIQAGCDSDAWPEMGTLQGQGSHPYAVHQITALRLLDQRPVKSGSGYEQIALSEGQALDLFQAASGGVSLHRQGWATLYPEITVSTGKNQRQRGVARLRASLEGDSGAFSLDNRGRIVLHPQSPGRATLRYALADARDQAHFEQSAALTSSRIHGLEWDAVHYIEPGARHTLTLPIGETLSLRFVVEGEADMAKYRVRWTARRAEAAQGVRFAESSGFRRDGGRWIAENRIQFDARRIKGEFAERGHPGNVLDRSALHLLAELLNPEGEIIATQNGPQITPGLPPINQIGLALLENRVAIPVQALDFFLPAPPGGRLGALGLILGYPGGRLITPLWLAEVNQLGVFPETFRIDKGRYSRSTGEMRLYGDRHRTDISSRDSGTGIVHASIDRLLAGEHGLTLAVDHLEDRLPLYFNKLVVDRLGATNAPAPFRLEVIGPTDVSAYTARWRFADGATETTRFEGRGSRTEQPHDRFEQVELVAASGKVVAVYVGGRDGPPLPMPNIRVQSLPGDLLVPGAKVRVSASISDLHERDAADHFCQWEVDPTFGSVSPAQSEVRASLIFGSCETTLTLSSNPDIAGQHFPVKARLVRKTGVVTP